jgi:hypothetical protein
MQRFIRVEPVLCRECGTRTVLRYTKRTLIQGWWGPISLFIANPFTIAMNLVALVQARRTPSPEYTIQPKGIAT